MAAPLDVRGDGWRMRLATGADNAALCQLFRSVHVKSALELTQERDPDFFALLRLHLAEFDSFVAESDSGEVVGCATLVRRPGWLEGERLPTGYLCDLRVMPSFRGGRTLMRSYAGLLDWVEREHGADLFTTVVFDSNVQARAALVKRGERPAGDPRSEQPRYRPMTPFQMTSVQFTTPKPPPERAITEAGPRDRDELFAFLIEKQRYRLLGECFDESLLQRRLHAWPGFSLGDFLLARSPAGRIVGCLAPWNSGACKRTRVLGYHGQMAWMRAGFNLAARLRGFPGLPKAGDCFDFWFLTHLEVDEDDPAVLCDLLRAAYQQLRARGGHFMSAMIPNGSRLERAFEGFFVNRTAMTIYAVHRKHSRWSEHTFSTLHPGFEMALS